MLVSPEKMANTRNPGSSQHSTKSLALLAFAKVKIRLSFTLSGEKALTFTIPCTVTSVSPEELPNLL